MGIEIERKFRVINDEYKKLGKPIFYKQGYFSTNTNPLIRIRIVSNNGFLTIKGKNKGICRLEYEYKIPIKDANELLDKFCSDRFIEKNRYIININNKKWEIDEFLGDNYGLVIAEIELNHSDEEFEKPKWIEKEISHQEKYFNYKLLDNPYSTW